MRVHFILTVAPLLILSACGGGPAAPPGLGYTLPSPTKVTYVTGDTLNMDIDAGGEGMQARGMGQVTLNAEFTRAPEGVQVSLEVGKIQGRITTPLSSASVDEDGVEEPLVFNLDRRGSVALVSQPEVTDQVAQFFQPVVLANSLFPKLPGRAAQAGEQWTDTVTFDGAQGSGAVKVTNIMTYTLVGDTVVDGQSVVRIDLSGTSESVASGALTGMDFSQNLRGSVEGWVLFDVARSLMVESRSDSDMRGSMDVSAAPYPLGVRVRSRTWVRLQESR